MEEFLETSWTLSTNAQNLSYRLKANESADLVKFAFRYSGEEYVGQPLVNVVGGLDTDGSGDTGEEPGAV